ncbi:unnamed protein product [Bemisia tabaci]|uniref:Uncharacterized protein n=1 Tax=Bemisia tabaci TaxID=7038 RepID=A0A9P0A5T7_BEMTA|nr:unnamed protein product [Bemisia tabaci]
MSMLLVVSRPATVLNVLALSVCVFLLVLIQFLQVQLNFHGVASGLQKVLPKRSFTLEDVSQALRAANLSAADIPCMMLTSKDFQRLCESLNVEFQC